MSKLVELSSGNHRAFKLDTNCQLQYAASQHLLNLRVNEVAQATCNFPVFFNKNMQNGYWNLSAVTSFEMARNLFVENNQWQAIYRPSCIQSYPFYLMNSTQNDKQYAVGIDENNPAFSETSGEALFDANSQATPFLGHIEKMLEANIQNDIQTFQFGKMLHNLNLLKSINVIVQYENQSPQTLTGLYTINEDELHSLSDSQLGELNRQGYLTPIHGILLSISQLNGLILKNNQRQDSGQIQSIKLEVTKI